MRSVTRTALGAALAATLAALALPSATAAPVAPRTEKVSTAPDGGQADASSTGPQLSGDGKVVAFTSSAANLVAGDTPGTDDVFVRTAGSDKLRRVSVEGAETAGPRLSRTGRYLTFTAHTPYPSVYTAHLRDLSTGRTERIAPALDDGYAVTGGGPVSADGRYVAVNATPTEATPQEKEDGSRVYLYDRTTKKAERVSRTPDDENGARGTGARSISDDGKKIAYQDAYTGGPHGGDWGDVFVYDRTTGKTVHADATYNGAEADQASLNPLLSADGSTVAFESYATNLVPGTDPNRGWNPFVRDLRTGTLTRVDGRKPTDIASLYGLSANGSKLLYSTYGAGSQGLWLRDLRTGTDVPASPDQEGNARGAAEATLSADASTVAFVGDDEGNFVPGDTNGEWDVFVRRLK